MKIAHAVVKLARGIKIEEIEMPKGDRMVRIGAGLNKFRGFARVDLWATGYRITKRKR